MVGRKISRYSPQDLFEYLYFQQHIYTASTCVRGKPEINKIVICFVYNYTTTTIPKMCGQGTSKDATHVLASLLPKGGATEL